MHDVSKFFQISRYLLFIINHCDNNSYISPVNYILININTSINITVFYVYIKRSGLTRKDTVKLVEQVVYM